MGYDMLFIPDFEVPLPTLGVGLAALALNNGTPIEHTRFSLVFHRERGLAIYTAHNIDGALLIPEGKIPRKDRFRLDPAVDAGLQLDNDRAYIHNPWDRGHLVRRRSLHWGAVDEAARADNESYFWTNIAPQHENLHDSAWGSIEDWMLDFADDQNQQACVFTGPVLTVNDPEIQNQPDELPFKLPAGFWKIIAIKHANRLRAAGFLVWQRDFDQDVPVSFDPLLEQVRLTTIEYLTGLSFSTLRTLDPLHFGVKVAVDGFGVRAPEVAAVRSGAVITSARDIVL